MKIYAIETYMPRYNNKNSFSGKFMIEWHTFHCQHAVFKYVNNKQANLINFEFKFY